MRLSKNKKLATMLSFVLLLSMTSSIVFVAEAQINGTSTAAFAYAVASPNPVAVGGTVYIAGWVVPPPHIIGNVFNNFTFVVTLPDGTKETKYFPTSNIDATQSYSFTCTQPGNYSVKLFYPGDAYVKNVASVSYTWSAIPNYVVPSIPNKPIPTGYWQFPVSAEDYSWFEITGGWLWAGNRLGYDTSNTNYNPYSTGPTTSHVLWRQEWDIGGLMGGEAGASANTGAHGGRSTGTPIWNNLQPVAANGRMYFTTTAGYTPTGANYTTIHPIIWCVSLWTGEIIYKVDLPINGSSTRPGTSGGTAGIVIREIPFVKGVAAETNRTTVPTTYYYDIWVTGGGLWQVNAFTGDCLFYTPLPGGCSTVYSDNNFYTWGYPAAGSVSCFNCVTKTWNWTQTNDQFYFSDWAVGCVQIPKGMGIIVEEDNQQAIMNFRTRDLKTGNLIVNVTMPEISSSEKPGTTVDGKLIWHCVDGTVRAWSLTTGQQVWASQPVGLPWSSFSSYWSSNAYGMCYFGTWDGYIRAYNVTNGALVWQTYSADSTETGTGSYPWWGNGVIADGKIYAATGQHTTPNPLPRGDRLYCLDAFTGEKLWSYPLQSGYGGIASGVLYYSNNYDDCLYAFGTGKSATTLSASPNLIQGTILDMSPGAPGVPCVSAESMTAQMQTIYANAAEAANITGVPVKITAIDPNGNYQNIGTVTSDRTGNYAIHWTPPVPGLYKVTATFEGSGAYYTSSAETHIYIDEKASPQPTTTGAPSVAPSPTAMQTPSPSPSNAIQPPTSSTPMVTYVVVAAAIVAIIIAIAAISLRRRK